MKAPAFDAPASDWLVYADSLQQAGNPLGELITLNHAVDSGKKAAAERDAFVREKAAALLGESGKHAGVLRLGWKLGWIDSFELVAKTSADLEALKALAGPLAANVRKLVLAGDPEGETRVEFAAAIADLAKIPAPKSIVELELVDKRAERSSSLISRDYSAPDNLVAFQELGPLWPLFPQLRTFRICVADIAQVGFGAIDAPELREFRLECLTWGGFGSLQGHAREISEAKWPKLEALELRMPETWTYSAPDDEGGYVRPYADGDYEEYEGDEGYHEPANMTEEIGAVLRSLPKTSIKRLALTSVDSGTQLLEALQACGLPPSLKELDLSHSNLGEAEARWIVDHSALFAKLERLVLKSTPMSGKDAQLLSKLGPKLEHSEGSGPSHRYLVGME